MRSTGNASKKRKGLKSLKRTRGRRGCVTCMRTIPMAALEAETAVGSLTERKNFGLYPSERNPIMEITGIDVDSIEIFIIR